MPPHLSVKVLIVDDHPLFRQGVRSALSTYDDIDVVADLSSGEAALQWLANAMPNREPSVALVDLNLNGMSGLDLTRTLRNQYPNIGVVMLSIHESDEYEFSALAAGASDYRSKDVNPSDLADVLRRVSRGEYVINDMVENPKVARRLLSQFRDLPLDYSLDAEELDFTLFQKLSDREIEVLERIAAGGSNKDIADSLGISTQTVKNHISSILRKLSLNDRTQAVLHALRRGWIKTPNIILGGGANNNLGGDLD